MNKREKELKELLGEDRFAELMELPEIETIDMDILKELTSKLTEDVPVEDIVEGVEIIVNYPKTVEIVGKDLSLEILKSIEWNGLNDEDASVALIFAMDMYSCTEVAVRSLWEISSSIVSLGGCKKAAAKARFAEMFDEEISIKIEDNLVIDWDESFDKIYQSENIQEIADMFYHYCD